MFAEYSAYFYLYLYKNGKVIHHIIIQNLLRQVKKIVRILASFISQFTNISSLLTTFILYCNAREALHFINFLHPVKNKATIYL